MSPKPKRTLNPKMKRRIEMLKTYAKEHNCTFGEAMKRTKGVKVDGGNPDTPAAADTPAVADTPAAPVDQPNNGPAVAVTADVPDTPVAGGRRRTKRNGSRRHRKSYRKKSPTKRKLFGLW